MYEIYNNTTFTLVLDGGLLNTKMGHEYTDVAMTITMCGWMRLWTLQEAVLSKDIFFNFTLKCCRMAYIEEAASKNDNKLLSSARMLARTHYHNILGSEELRTFIKERKRPNPTFVAAVLKAVQWRTTTHLIHETLALAVQLNIDSSPFADWKEIDPKSRRSGRNYMAECKC
jgi:hypothetical protein